MQTSNYLATLEDALKSTDITLVTVDRINKMTTSEVIPVLNGDIPAGSYCVVDVRLAIPISE
jgi:hypothetical protein